MQKELHKSLTPLHHFPAARALPCSLQRFRGGGCWPRCGTAVWARCNTSSAASRALPLALCDRAEPALGASSAGLEGKAGSGRMVGGQTAVIMPVTLR